MRRVAAAAVMIMAGQCAFAAEPTATEVIQKSLSNTQGVEDIRHELKMVLVDEEGDRTEREMLVKALFEDNTSYSMSIFTAPSREKGIALLTVSKKSEAEDAQYLYLPSTRRVKRINSASKSGSFRGSEFTFEDLSGQKIEDYTFSMIGQKPCAKQSCYVIDRKPIGEDSSYSKTTLWIDTEHYRLMQADFFDRDGKALKVMTAGDFKQVADTYWNPERILMANVQNGKKTELLSQKLEINSGLNKREFTELAMRNWR